MMRAIAALVVGLVFAGLPGVADADPPAALAKARTAVDNLDYLTAKTALADALVAGTASPDDLADIYRLTGIVAGALGDAKAATDAFEHWLALVPKATLPAGTSPKITRPFAAASKFFRTHEPLHAKAETSAEDPSITIVVTSDPLTMIDRVRATVVADGRAEKALEKAGNDRITIELPHGKRLDIRVALLDEHGNHVIELGSTDTPLVITGAIEKQVTPAPPPVTPPPVEPVAERPLWKAWWLWGGVAAVMLGTGSYFGYDALQAKNDLDALNAHSEAHSFDEAKAIESRGKRDALVANIGWAAGGAVGAVAIILYVTRPKAMEARVTTVTPVPVRGGGAIVLGVPF